MKKLLLLFIALVSGVSLASTTDGVGNLYWIGDVDANYATPGNWRFSSASGAVMQVAPINNDYQANIYLTDAAPEEARTITAAYQCNSIVVQSGTGWDYKLNGSPVVKTLTVKSGAEFTLSEGSLKNNNTTVEAGAVATVRGMYWDSSKSISGGGTLIMGSGPGGYSKARTATIGATLVRVNSDKLFSGTMGNSYIMNNKDGRVQYKGTLAAAQNLVGVSGDGKGGVVAGSSIPDGYELAVRQLDGDLSGYVEFYFRQTSEPIISAASLSRTEGGAYEVTVRLSQGAEGTTVKAIADDGAGNTVETEYAGTVEVDADMSFELANLAANRTYIVKVVATNDTAVDEKAIDAVFYNGQLSLALIADAFERDTVAGTVSVSRVSADAYPLTVNYAFTGVTAVEGVDYEAPSGTIVIPAGEVSAMIPVQPIMNAARAEDTTLQVSLSAGMYDASAAPVAVTIHDFTIPTDSCVWMGNSGVDNNASTASNWYNSKLPTKDDKIMLAVFSPSNIVWDAGVNGLPDTVASWEQTVDYTGTVTFKTVYPNGDDTAFTNFTVTGDCIVNGGKWTHMANDSAEVYSLNVTVGGNLTIGAGGTITVMGKGYAVGKFPSGSAIGAHAATYTGDSSHIYGDVYAPTRCGSGGASGNNSASCGGGVIVLSVAGSAVIDGTLDAQSSTQSSAKNGNPEKGVGAGGSIFVTAASISGSGTVIASAYENNGTSYSSEAGSGGRIALVATTGDVTIPNANLKCSGSFGGNGVGGGTIFVKNASDAYGTLLIEDRKAYSVYNYATHWPTKGRFAMVKSDETWTFDRILFRGRGVLSVPEGATLALPNGFASISCAENNSAPNAGILYLGGTISVPDMATHEMSGSWLFQAASPYSFPAGDVVLSDKAAIGCFELHSSGADPTNQPNCDVTVNGNMTIASGSSLLATGRGHRSTVNSPYGGAHGGIGNGMANTKAFDSILHPRYAGGSAGSGDGGINNNVSGGAIKLTVVGSMTMNGSANVKSGQTSWGNNRAASGSLDITAESLSGTGSFCADGLVSESSSVLSGTGGRIAIHLTGEGATFDNFDVTKITANAAMSTGSPAKAGSAGTVYLESGTPGSGTVIVKSTNSGVTTPTPIPSQTWGGEDDDLDKASLSIQSYGIVALTESLKMSSLTVGANAKLDLNGNTLTVKSAKLGDTTLPVGTYAAGDPALVGFVSDSASGGSLVVSGAGTVILFR